MENINDSGIDLLIKTYMPKVYAAAYYCAPDDAQAGEWTRDAFRTAIAGIKSIPSQLNFEIWVFRKLIKVLGKHSRTRHGIAEPESTVGSARQALSHLDVREKMLVLLTDLLGYAPELTAVICEVKPDKIKTEILKARAKVSGKIKLDSTPHHEIREKIGDTDSEKSANDSDAGFDLRP